MSQAKAIEMSKQELLDLKAKHKTQQAVSDAVGVSRYVIVRLAKRYSIDWPVTRNIHGNAEWQALGE